jgi:EPS-associated MarR family transcriptional regulator
MSERTPERAPDRAAEPRPADDVADDGQAGLADRELELLRLLERHPEYSQRQMSSALGVSLGKAHYLLKALLNKGWVKARNFKRNPNKVGYLYVLTPHGVRQRLHLTRAFLARKEREYDLLQTQIAALRAELGAQSGRNAELGAQPPSRNAELGAQPPSKV